MKQEHYRMLLGVFRAAVARHVARHVAHFTVRSVICAKSNAWILLTLLLKQPTQVTKLFYKLCD